MNIQRAVAHTHQHLKTAGLGETVRWMLRRAEWRWHERRLGIHTEDAIQAENLGFTNSEWSGYAPTDYADFARIMGLFDPACLTSHVFVDYGAGMGRTMVLAAGYPFARVCGVEFSPALAAIARRNIAIARPKLKCRDIELRVGNATEYRLPQGASMLYFNNAFSGGTLETVVGRIRETVARTGKPISFVSNSHRDSHARQQLHAHADWLQCRKTLRLSDRRICEVFRAGVQLP
jgi:hypothetical protein